MRFDQARQQRRLAQLHIRRSLSLREHAAIRIVPHEPNLPCIEHNVRMPQRLLGEPVNYLSDAQPDRSLS